VVARPAHGSGLYAYGKGAVATLSFETPFMCMVRREKNDSKTLRDINRFSNRQRITFHRFLRNVVVIINIIVVSVTVIVFLYIDIHSGMMGSICSSSYSCFYEATQS
jgi:hypothetical protein